MFYILSVGYVSPSIRYGRIMVSYSSALVIES